MSENVQLLDYPEVESFLYAESTEIETVDDNIVSLAHQMAHIMYNSDGIGISAPQVGINKRLIVLDCTEEKNNTVYIINPVITWQSREISQSPEACLSYPGLVMPVSRPKRIKVEGVDLDGKKISFEASGLYARCICHEVDHLDGIPYIQRVSRQVRRHLIRKWKKGRNQSE